MTVGSQRCRWCGGEPHGDTPCLLVSPVAQDERVNPTCICLPTAPAGWLACAHCGLPQAPGKAFCDFCGNRWQAEVASSAG